MLAFAFGLFHGFGFAGLLSELGLDRSNRFPSLLGFNIGVELGQAAIILMVFPMLFILRRTRYYLPVMYAGSVVLSLVALAWATERIFDYDTQVNELVDPILQWPRSALSGRRRLRDRRGALVVRPVAGPAGPRRGPGRAVAERPRANLPSVSWSTSDPGVRSRLPDASAIQRWATVTASEPITTRTRIGAGRTESGRQAILLVHDQAGAGAATVGGSRPADRRRRRSGRNMNSTVTSLRSTVRASA